MKDLIKLRRRTVIYTICGSGMDEFLSSARLNQWAFK